jgi:hypothetical protein
VNTRQGNLHHALIWPGAASQRRLNMNPNITSCFRCRVPCLWVAFISIFWNFCIQKCPGKSSIELTRHTCGRFVRSPLLSVTWAIILPEQRKWDLLRSHYTDFWKSSVKLRGSENLPWSPPLACPFSPKLLLHLPMGHCYHIAPTPQDRVTLSCCSLWSCLKLGWGTHCSHNSLLWK